MPSTPVAKANAALLSMLDEFGDRPFRRSDLASRLAGRRRLHREKRDELSDLADTAIKAAASAGRIVRSGHVHWKRASATRVLVDGGMVAELQLPVKVTLDTKAPEQWLLVDRYSGQVWQPTVSGSLKAAPEQTADAVIVALKGIASRRADS